MAATKLVFLLALVACGSAYNSLHDTERIIGGEVAPAGLAPFAVSLRSGLLIRSHFCGGSLISTTFIVTAAHCVDAVYSTGIIGGGSLSSSLQVQSGVQNLNNAGIKSTVKANYTFGMWDSYNLVYDIALLELTAALTETSTLRPIPLNANVIPGGEVLTAVGWGLTKYPSGSTVNELVTIKTNSLDYSTCSDMRDVASGDFAGFFPLIYDDQEICTFKAVGEGMCKGDSGSALFNDDGLVGIVSWGLPCAKLAPDVFTRVSTFVPWIQDIIGQ